MLTTSACIVSLGASFQRPMTPAISFKKHF
jgi:hypothetical protein